MKNVGIELMDNFQLVELTQDEMMLTEGGVTDASPWLQALVNVANVVLNIFDMHITLL